MPDEGSLVVPTPVDVHDFLARAEAQIDAALQLPGSTAEQARCVAEAQALLAVCAQRLAGGLSSQTGDSEAPADRAARHRRRTASLCSSSWPPIRCPWSPRIMTWSGYVRS